MKKFIFTVKKHLFSMPDENMYSKALRRGTTTFAALILTILLLLYTGPVWGATHILTEAMGEKIYPTTFYPDARPGDTIIIDKNRKSNVQFKNFDGTTTNPYTFTNPSDSKVTINTGTTNGIQFFDSDNFILIGNNYASETYGIEIDGTPGGIRLWRCADWEVAYIHIHDTGAGISQNNNDPWTQANSMGVCRVHHCLIEDTAAIFAEGMYFGKSITGDHPQWDLLEIDHNKVYRTGSDCIQAGQTESLLIHDNYCEDCGTQNDGAQNFGINLSAEASGIEVYRNMIVRARKNGIEVNVTAGEATIHDNVIWNAGYGEPGNGIKICSSSGTSTVINNTVVESIGGYGIKTYSRDTTGEIRYNLLVANGSGGIFSSYTNRNNNRIVASTTTEHFRDANAGDFSLTENSPSRDSGQGGGASPIDHTGATRPYSSTAADIGAYEFRPQTIRLDSVKGLRLVPN